MKSAVRQLIELAICSDDYLTCGCSSEKNNEITNWSSTCSVKEKDTTQLKSQKQTPKRYIKDCTNCRKLTKNCSFNCKQRIKFEHYKQNSSYLEEYEKLYSSVCNAETGIIFARCEKEKEKDIVLPIM